MNSLTLCLTKTPNFKLDCRNLTPDNLAGLSFDEINNLALNQQKNAPKIGEYFIVSGTDVDHLVLINSHQNLDYLGYKMSIGLMIVKGDCGNFLGAQMQGGTIICNGNAGDRVGDQMRRGLILIDGDSSNYLASRMVAGTIAVYGHTGLYAGFGMKRGTLLLRHQPTFIATIQDCGQHTLPFMQILLQSFRQLPSKFANLKITSVRKFSGDLSCNGQGEILIC